MCLRATVVIWKEKSVLEEATKLRAHCDVQKKSKRGKMKIEDITSVLVFCCRSNQGHFSFFFFVELQPGNSFVQVDVNLCKCTKLLNVFFLFFFKYKIGIISYMQ